MFLDIPLNEGSLHWLVFAIGEKRSKTFLRQRRRELEKRLSEIMASEDKGALRTEGVEIQKDLNRFRDIEKGFSAESRVKNESAGKTEPNTQARWETLAIDEALKRALGTIDADRPISKQVAFREAWKLAERQSRML